LRCFATVLSGAVKSVSRLMVEWTLVLEEFRRCALFGLEEEDPYSLHYYLVIYIMRGCLE
jgi:hypothetical protein